MPVKIVYDGECPFCTNYAAYVRLRQTFGAVELIDARAAPDLNRELLAKGVNLDDGMAVIDGETIYAGADAMNFLSLNGQGGLMHAAMKSKGRAEFLYPWMRRGRNMALRLLGKQKLNR